MFAPLPINPALALDDPHLNKAELGNTQRTSGVPELEGSAGRPSQGPAVFEMPVREEVASELRATNNNAHEMLTPDTSSVAAQAGFAWRTSLPEGGPQSPTPLESPGLQDIVSPLGSSSPGSPSPIPSLSMAASSVPSPLPSPPPVAQP